MMGYTNMEIIRPAARLVSPMTVSIIVQDFSVVFSSISRNVPTSQNPASLTWLNAVAPPQMAQHMTARYTILSPITAGMEAIIPEAMVIATIELPTDARTMSATKNAIRINGISLFSSRGPITLPRPES